MIYRITQIVILLCGISLITWGCEGEPGRPGINLLGDDLQPPAVELVLPLARQTIYGEAVIEAHVIDIGLVERVEFYVDGIFDTSAGLIADQYPWIVTWDCSAIPLGPHYIQASAWDQSGKRGLSPLVMVVKADVNEQPAVDTISYYDPASEGDVTWQLPDNQGRYTGYGTRFTLNRPGRLKELYFRFFQDFDWTEAEMNIEVRTSQSGEPDSLIFNTTLSSQTLRIQGEIRYKWFNIIRRSEVVMVPREFFVLTTLTEDTPNDSTSIIGIMSDEGLWKNWHGVVQKDDGWSEFTAGPQIAYNPLIYAVMQY